jgi:hypothetical protein
MAWSGVRIEALRTRPVLGLIYWGGFLLLFLSALYCVFLDLRHIRAERVIAERQIFRETLGEESFRKSLRAAQEESARKAPPNPRR